MQPGPNLLTIQEPEKYICQIHSYTWDHKALVVEAVHMLRPTEKFYVHFIDVLSYSGVMGWRGAVLRLGSDMELMQYYMQMMPGHGKSPADLLDRDRAGSLYIFEGDKRQIKILALHLEQSTSV